jgi:hypothetical protein
MSHLLVLFHVIVPRYTGPFLAFCPLVATALFPYVWYIIQLLAIYSARYYASLLLLEIRCALFWKSGEA